MITLFFIVVLLLTLLCLAFLGDNRELTSPTFAFLAPLILTIIVSMTFQKKWGLELASGTAFVLLIGPLFFFFGTRLGKIINIKREMDCAKFPVIPSKIRLIGLFIFQVGTIILTFKTLIAIYGGGTLSVILGSARTSNTTNDQELILPGYLSFFNAISFISGVIMAILIAYCLVHRESSNLKKLIANYFLSILASLLSGSRGIALILLSVLVCSLLMENAQKYNWKKTIPMKYLILFFAVAMLIFFNFQNITVLLGQIQAQDIKFEDYISIYIGAQVKNIDIAIQNREIATSKVFAQETARSCVQIVAKIIGNPKWTNYRLHLPMRYYNGVSLGNVCTTFYPFLEDFGYAGVFTMPALMGVISEIVYKKAKYANRKCPVNIWNMIWGIMFYTLLFSFFSNKFYEMFFSTSFVKYIICMWILKWFLYQDFKKVPVPKLRVRI